MLVEMIVTNNNLPLMSELHPLMNLYLDKALHNIGEETKRRAVQAIHNQVAPDDSAWTPLAAWWQKWKEAHGYSDQIYIMSSSYVEAITMQVFDGRVLADTGDKVAVIGVMKEAQGMTVDGRLSIADVAQILEYGWEQYAVNIPPRPLWRPLNQIMLWRARTMIGQAIYQAKRKIEKQAKGSVEL